MGYWTDIGNKTFARVADVTGDIVRLIDGSGGTIDASLVFGAPSLPQKGQTWLLEHVGGGAYMLVRDISKEYTTKHVKWSLAVDSPILLNNEDNVVHSAKDWGFDNLIIPALAENTCFFPSDSRSGYGINQGGDLMTDTVRFAKDAGMGVYAYVSSTAFGQSTYRQAHYTPGTYAPWYSPVSAKGPLLDLIGEMDGIRGVVMDVGYYSSAYDDRLAADFQARYGVPRPTSVDTASDAFWKWQEFKESAWTGLLVAIRERFGDDLDIVAKHPVGQWFVPDAAAANIATGRIAHGLSAESVVGRSAVTAPLISDLFGATEGDKAVSAEWTWATAERMGADVVIRVDDILLPQINAAARYDVGHVIVYGYQGMSSMTDDRRRQCKAAMESVSLQENVLARQSVGLVVSHDSRDVGYFYNGAQGSPDINGIRYAQAIQRQFSLIVKNGKGFRPRLLFDSDLATDMKGIKGVLLIGVKNIDHDVCNHLVEIEKRGDRFLLVFGVCGVYGQKDRTFHPDFPLPEMFGVPADGVDVIVDGFSIGGDAPLFPGAWYTSAPRTGYHSEGDVYMAFKVKDRSIFFNPDMFSGNELDAMVWRMAMFVTGKGDVSNGLGTSSDKMVW